MINQSLAYTVDCQESQDVFERDCYFWRFVNYIVQSYSVSLLLTTEGIY